MKRFLRDESGNAISDLLAFSPTWFVVFSVFLMNVQLGRNCVQRDMVDHATAVAADIASKTYCQTQGTPTQSAMTTAITPLMQLASSAPNPCTVTATPSGSGSDDSGSQQLNVQVTCSFPCTIPLASQLMCTSGSLNLSATQTTVAMGCDAS